MSLIAAFYAGIPVGIVIGLVLACLARANDRVAE